jgi:uncharacterized Zn-binding protein involved in type VI secretion
MRFDLAWIFNRRRGEEPPAAQKAEAAADMPRTYDHMEIVLPSGRFASMSKVRAGDVLFAQDMNGLAYMIKLTSKVVAIDGVPITLDHALAMEMDDFGPIMNMLGQAASKWNPQGIA